MRVTAREGRATRKRERSEEDGDGGGRGVGTAEGRGARVDAREQMEGEDERIKSRMRMRVDVRRWSEERGKIRAGSVSEERRQHVRLRYETRRAVQRRT